MSPLSRPKPPRHRRRGSDGEEAWLDDALGAGERVLAWLGVASAELPDGEGLPPYKVTWRFLLTTERALLVATPRGRAQGQVLTYPLPEGSGPEIRGTIGRDEVSLGPFRFRATFRDEALLAEAVPLVALQGMTRRREAARLCWIHRGRDAAPAEHARLLLEADPLRRSVDDLSLAFIAAGMANGDEEESPLDEEGAAAVSGALSKVASEADGGAAVAEWAVAWQVPPARQIELVQLLLDVPGVDPSTALPLHRQARAGLVRFEKELTRLALLDLAFADHLLRAERRDEAARVLEGRLAHLPDESLHDLLPPEEVDLTAAGSQVVRIRLLELLVKARGEGGSSDPAAVAELARLQPLVRQRIEELEAVVGGSLAERAAALARLLGPEGLSSSPVDGGGGDRERVRALPVDIVDDLVPHPAARAGGAFEWLQERLGKVRAPDHDSLRAFTERVTAKAHPEVMAILTDGALALGVSAIEAYVSRGERAVGLRAYDSSPPFVVIGSEHLDPASDAFMEPPALAFAVGTEVAHLRFGHTRLTSSEVWDGIFHKGGTLLELVGAFAGPLGLLGSAVGGLRRVALVQGLLASVELVSKGAGRAAEAMGLARGVRQAGDELGDSPPKATEIGERHSELLAACRLLQLTADRAGLVLSGDLCAATEAIFLASADYRAELDVARRHGLVTTLSRRDASGELMHQPLAVRLAALFSFYLSDDYAELRAALIDG